MSDSKLRAAKRKWIETGMVDDEALYLRERLRVGNLKRRGLALLAHAGHPAAQMLMDADDPNAFNVWVKGFGHWSTKIRIGLADLVLRAAMERHPDLPQDALELGRRALQALPRRSTPGRQHLQELCLNRAAQLWTTEDDAEEWYLAMCGEALRDPLEAIVRATFRYPGTDGPGIDRITARRLILNYIAAHLHEGR